MAAAILASWGSYVVTNLENGKSVIVVITTEDHLWGRIIDSIVAFAKLRVSARE
jgi:hypothetical protein